MGHLEFETFGLPIGMSSNPSRRVRLRDADAMVDINYDATYLERKHHHEMGSAQVHAHHHQLATS